MKKKTDKEKYKEIVEEFHRYAEDGTDNNDERFIQTIYNIIKS